MIVKMLTFGMSGIALVVAIAALISSEYQDLRVTVYCDDNATKGVVSPIFVTPGGDNPNVTMRVHLNKSNPDCVPDEGKELRLTSPSIYEKLRVAVYCDGQATTGVASPIFITPKGDDLHVTMRVHLNKSNPDCVPDEGKEIRLAVR